MVFMKCKAGIRIFALLFLFTVPFAHFSGCGGDSEYKRVDFSKTVAISHPDTHPAQDKVLRVAVAAMISPKETFIYYRELLDYIGRNAGLGIQLIQRKTYDEINALFPKGEIDLAFICTGPYAAAREKYGFEALATPQVRGKPFYQSYLIVAKDSPYRSLEELRGRVFAFTDPDSNTGTLVPNHWLAQVGETPETFFQKTVYTYSHDNSILAVARGLVDGAAVDGHQWEYFQHFTPALTARPRVIRKSEPYGSPPLVASERLPDELKTKIRGILLSMHQEPDGRAILDKLLIDRFLAPREEWYEPVRAMIAGLPDSGRSSHAPSKP
jgi:phosphonate transport system substrate-binding protein